MAFTGALRPVMVADVLEFISSDPLTVRLLKLDVPVDAVTLPVRLPVTSPVTLPVTAPVRGPLKPVLAVIDPTDVAPVSVVVPVTLRLPPTAAAPVVLAVPRYASLNRTADVPRSTVLVAIGVIWFPPVTRTSSRQTAALVALPTQRYARPLVVLIQMDPGTYPCRLSLVAVGATVASILLTPPKPPLAAGRYPWTDVVRLTLGPLPVLPS